MKVITIESSAFTALTEQIAEIAVYVRAVSGVMPSPLIISVLFTE